jgi:hypothetical protein
MISKNTLCLISVLLTLLLVGCGESEPYHETYDTPGNWSTDNDSEVRGQVIDGVYDFEIVADNLTSWTTAGLEFTDGYYQVEATQIGGPDNNLYGLTFRMNNENNDFYAFQVSGDGYVWIGRYQDGGLTEMQPIVQDWWFESPAVNQGIGVSNELGVRAEKGNLIFYVNGQEVGRVTDNTFDKGDIGLIVGSLGQGGVHVQFDDFQVLPLTELAQ